MKKKHSLLNLILYIIAISLFCSIGFIYYFNKKLGPGLIECAENEIERLTTIVMNNCIRKYISTNPNPQNILKITRNNRNEIELIQYDTNILNQTTTTITSMLEQDLDYMVKGQFDQLNLNLKNISDNYYEKINDGILFTVSMGSSTGNSLLANIGPKIPLNLSIVGDALTNIETKITEYGMNNAMIEVFVKLEATTVIHMPFLSKKVTIETTIPLTMEIIQGNIPNYYLESTLHSE